VLLLTVFRHDTPRYLVQTGQEDKAVEILTKIFGGNEARVKDHLEMLKNEREFDKKAVSISFID